MICKDGYPAALWVAPYGGGKKGGCWDFDASHPGFPPLVRYERVDSPGSAALAKAFEAVSALRHPPTPGGHVGEKLIHDEAISAALEAIREAATPETPDS